MQTQTLSSLSSLSAFLAAGLLAIAVPAMAAEEPAMDHSKMGHDMARDAEGRTLYGMKHQMDPKLIQELREKVALFRNYTDGEIGLAMDLMGMEYAWYISPPELNGPRGVLILTHGFGERGDKVFREQMASFGNAFPTAMGIGMSMMMSQQIQIALDNLTAAGAKEIAVVPVTSSAVNELYRQWLYVFGRQDHPEFATVPRVKTDAVLKFVPPPGDNPLVAEALLDFALEISTDPKNEVVIIAGHGPSGAADNELEMKVLANLARIVKEDGGFAAVHGQTLQDDAPAEIRDANVRKLRALVENATKDGKGVLVVTNLISTRSVQAKLRGDLKDLDYKFNAKGMVQHPNFNEWMAAGIHRQFGKTTAP